MVAWGDRIMVDDLWVANRFQLRCVFQDYMHIFRRIQEIMNES